MRKDTRKGDRHLHPAVRVRLGADQARVEKYALEHELLTNDGSPNRSLVVRMAVSEFLDRNESQQGEDNG